MRIRQLRADEGAVLLSLWNAANATPSLTDTVDDLGRALDNDRFACLVAEADGVVVGSIIAAFDGWRGNIYRLAVAPEHRRRGIARQLVKAAHEAFARWGVRRITALVESDHPWAVSFWGAVGYSRDEKMARFVRNIPSGRVAVVSESDVESRESVLRYLRSLGDKDVVEIFYDAVRGRSTGDVPEAKDHYVIAHVSTEDEEWTLDVIAGADPERYPNGWASDVPVCQWGACEACGSRVRSWAKHMLCPVCGGKASGS